MHHGNCAAPDAVHAALDNIVADETGAGTQTTANNEAPLTHFEAGHYLAVQQSEDDPTVVACGDVVSAVS